ncbi:MAG TPA: thiamine-phosphate kinase [Pyrinomonadaceae bacterium]|jgi:thiamine-monophosphate kinase|nr:thiamine-phosphate kinase [Pyrinomonadaceae bacterium]
MVSEFQFINHVKKRFSLDHLGDDCAVLAKDAATDLLITADILIEDIDFRLEWATPEQIGHKALAVSLSDIAAMGGTPTGALLSIGVPQELWGDGFAERFYNGWHELASKFRVELVGGDTSMSPDKFVVDSIVLGEVPKGTAVLRSGAQPADAIFVTGTLGGPHLGLRLLESQTPYSALQSIIERQLLPTPQVALGKRLRELGIITSMIDLSDGLASDLGHICEASGVGAVLEAAAIPIDPRLFEILSFDESLEAALSGGEDFELLFTVAESDVSILVDLSVTRIGTITSEPRKLEIIRNGNTEPLTPSGFRHF